MAVFASILIALGIILLTAALFPVRRLIGMLPATSVRRYWYLLAILTVVFIAGYITYAIFHGGTYSSPADMLVPVIFFLGALFVLLVSTLSMQTAVDLQRIRYLEHETLTDPLMGIYNRRYLERRLKEEVGRARRYHLPLTMLIIDVDEFKLLNDTWGHPIGDQVLVQLGKLVVNNVRFTDIVARYGGDEVVIIAPNTAEEEALKLGERLRSAIESTSLTSPELTGGSRQLTTASVGITTLRDEPSEIAFLASADLALYQAKKAGRNQAVLFRPEARVDGQAGS